MKNLFNFLILLYISIFFGQEDGKFPHSSSFDLNYAYGNIANHNSNALIFITEHPKSTILGWSRKTFGDEGWQERFNYPDKGYSFIYQTFKNDILGKSYSLLRHYNFYFLNRKIMLRLGQGIAYVTTPYDPQTNRRNVAYASHVLSSSLIMLNYKQEHIFKSNFGVQTGIIFTHNSNGKTNTPNAGINIISANLGLIYSLGSDEIAYRHTPKENNKVESTIGYNFGFKTGVNQSSLIGSEHYIFYIPTFFFDMRLNEISGVQLGTEAFLSQFLKEEIRYNAIAYPEKGVDPNTDYRRVGIYAGHELFINHMSVMTQVGYYVYYPYEFEKRIYLRVGLKKSMGKHFYGSLSLRAHAAKAEALEFGIGYKIGGKSKNEPDE